MPGPMTMKDAEVFVAKLKEKYPKPHTSGSRYDGANTYCVGGAYIRTLRPDHATYERAFPGAHWLSAILRSHNHALDDTAALMYARCIIYTNDNGEFNKAYEALLAALTYQPKP